MKTALREIAQIHTGDFRLTPSQNLTISGVTDAQKPMIDAILARHGLTEENKQSRLRLNALSCVALPTCGLALAESERALPEILAKFETVLDEAGLRRRRHQPARHRLPQRLRPPLPRGDRLCRQGPQQIRALPRREVQRHAPQPPRLARASPSTKPWRCSRRSSSATPSNARTAKASATFATARSSPRTRPSTASAPPANPPSPENNPPHGGSGSRPDPNLAPSPGGYWMFRYLAVCSGMGGDGERDREVFPPRSQTPFGNASL